MASEGGSRRILIDGTMARGGGGLTYLVNVIPRLARIAPNNAFRLLIRNPRVAELLPALPNLEVDLLPEVGLLGRLRFTHLEIPRIAREWGADLFFSAGETAPVWAPAPWWRPARWSPPRPRSPPVSSPQARPRRSRRTSRGRLRSSGCRRTRRTTPSSPSGTARR